MTSTPRKKWRVGMKVRDKLLGVGKIIKVMKTRIRVILDGKEHTYDIPHTQFLETL